MSAQTKYDVPDGHWDDRPRISGHAREMYESRLPGGIVDIETAYERSVPVHDSARPLFQTGDHDVPDGVRLVRLHAGGLTVAAVFLEAHDSDPTVVTVYPVASRYDHSIRAYCRARIEEVDE